MSDGSGHGERGDATGGDTAESVADGTGGTEDDGHEWPAGSAPWFTFYGDDFTGSTDALEALATAGVRTVLFLERPDPGDVAAFGNVEAVGMAGTSRSMSPAEMDEHLPAAFAALGALDPDVVHYKVCSTLDSSPTVGSIGHALDLGQRTFDSPFVPLVVATPSLEPRGRYVVFGNHFATVDGTTYRLDRHPTMSTHPVTPMTESDLRRHLGEQTDRSIGLVELRHLDDGDGARAALEAALDDSEVVLFDGLNHDHQRRVGGLLVERIGRIGERGDDPLFAVGSSGFEYAVTGHLGAAGRLDPGTVGEALAPHDRILVVSGSASPVTADQIEWALANGFEGIGLDAPSLVDPDAAAAERERAVERALAALADGDSPLLYSARGPDDPAIEATQQRFAEVGGDALGPRLGDQQGRIAERILRESDPDRLCVAGGDTSGHVAGRLDVFALEYAAPVGPGSPLCRASARTDRFDGLEVALKGGQVETRDDASNYFGVVREGGR
jgi:uncharacterized protein YgbK (DUF1537 family)